MIGIDLKDKLIGKDPFGSILGQESVKEQVKSALLVNRHILIVGPPGVGKTTLARDVAALLDSDGKEEKKKSPKDGEGDSGDDGHFVRIQGSPDLTVEDILGDIDPIKAMKFGPASLEAFNKGKIFKADNGVLFFDELNRCPEKLQNSLLQVLQEGKATIGSYDVDFDLSFIFIATMNPEDSSTEKLSDVLLDRFDVVYMSYPETDEIEKEIVVSQGAKLVDVDEVMLSLIVHFVRVLRESKDLEVKPSVRASLGLYERSQSYAMLAGRKAVEEEDVEKAIISVLAHRLKLKPSVKYLKSPEEFIKEEFSEVLKSNFLKETKKKI